MKVETHFFNSKEVIRKTKHIIWQPLFEVNRNSFNSKNTPIMVAREAHTTARVAAEAGAQPSQPTQPSTNPTPTYSLCVAVLKCTLWREAPLSLIFLHKYE